MSESKHLIIRDMSFDDLESVAALEKANFSSPWSETGFLTYLLRDDTKFLVAEKDGRIAGYCGAILITPESEITNICVDASFRRQGIAAGLLTHLKKELASLTIDTIHLEVRKSNTEAIALYQKHDFHPVGCRTDYYTGPVEDAILMTYKNIY